MPCGSGSGRNGGTAERGAGSGGGGGTEDGQGHEQLYSTEDDGKTK